MSKEEPAWKAELRQDILNAAIAVNTAYRDHRVQPWTPMTDAVMATLAPHIKAAEQRGREAALRKAAGEIHRMAFAMRSCDGTWDEEFSNEYVGDALGFAADLIDPDRS